LIVMTSPRPAIVTSTAAVRDAKSPRRLPWSGRLRAIGLGCYTTIGFAALAFLIVR
jgi:hypothetical protein